MKKLTLSIFSLFVFVCVLLLGANGAKAWTDVSDWEEGKIIYYIHTAAHQGNNLHIEGYAYRVTYQNYSSGNHDYWVEYVGSNGTVKTYPATKFQQSENLTAIHAIDGYPTCGETTRADQVTCGRVVNYAGFKVDIPLSDFQPDETYVFWIKVRETSGGTRDAKAKIIAPNISMPIFEWNHNTYQIDSTMNTTYFTNHTYGIKVRQGAGKWAAQYEGYTWPFSNCSNQNRPYWGVDGKGIFYNVYAFSSSPSDGVWVQAGFTNSCNALTYTYGRWSQDALNGTTAAGWINIDYANMKGTPLTLKILRKSYIGDIQLETKTAKIGDEATIKATVQNTPSSGDNPAIVQIEVGGEIVYDSGEVIWSGNKTFSVDIPSTSNNRVAKVIILETINEKRTEMSTTLYAASNQVNSVSDVSGTIRGDNPIYVIKNKTGEYKYYETFKYDQFDTYYALDDDNILKKKVKVSYTTDYTPISEWDADDIDASSYVSSPQATYAMDNTVRTGTEVQFAKDKEITWTNLNLKDTYTTVTGLGANNITIKLNAKYQFIDATDITVIDTRTHLPGEGEVYVTIHNDKERKVKYKIYYEDQLLVEGEDTWNGDKNFELNPDIYEPGKIRVEIIQPNTIPEELEGNVHIASEEEVHINKNGSFTPETPVREVTTPNWVKKYYETITVESGDDDDPIPAGSCIDNDIRIRYSTTEDTIDLNTGEISSETYYPSKDSGLSYEKQDNGKYLVPQETDGTGSYVDSTLPRYWVDKYTGEVYTEDEIPEDADAIDGGRCWYIPMDTPEGNYDYETKFDRVGVNKMDVIVDNDYDVEGSLLGNTNSVYKIIRVKNPATPNFTWHQTYSLKELLEKFNK